MYIEQLYTNCLAEAAYYIESGGVAAIIDPIRETEPYLKLAAERNATIKYVFETHFHADFISGHLDLASKTGAKIIFGPQADPSYPAYIAKDGEEFRIGNIIIRVIHTPGHTPESSCYLLLNEEQKPHAIFTGDTLFIGDVGRPDLAIKSHLTQDDLAGMLFDSLNNKIKTLPDDVIVYPAHGAGSSCGKNISKERSSTIADQKAGNYAMKITNRGEFIKAVTEGLTAPPLYFQYDARVNKHGYQSLEDLLAGAYKFLEPFEFKKGASEEEAVILDTRHQDEFEKGFVAGSVNVGLDGQFAIWVGSLISPEKKLYIVAPEGREREAVVRLARVGYENIGGILKGGIRNWQEAGNPLEKIPSVEPNDFATMAPETENVIDVRNPGEWESGVLPNATLIPLAELEQNVHSLDVNKKYFIHCAGGYRSMMAASIMKKLGFDDVVNVHGGMSKIKEAGARLVKPEVVK